MFEKSQRISPNQAPRVREVGKPTQPSQRCKKRRAFRPRLLQSLTAPLTRSPAANNDRIGEAEHPWNAGQLRSARQDACDPLGAWRGNHSVEYPGPSMTRGSTFCLMGRGPRCASGVRMVVSRVKSIVIIYADMLGPSDTFYTCLLGQHGIPLFVLSYHGLPRPSKPTGRWFGREVAATTLHTSHQSSPQALLCFVALSAELNMGDADRFTPSTHTESRIPVKSSKSSQSRRIRTTGNPSHSWSSGVEKLEILFRTVQVAAPAFSHIWIPHIMYGSFDFFSNSVKGSHGGFRHLVAVRSSRHRILAFFASTFEAAP